MRDPSSVTINRTQEAQALAPGLYARIHTMEHDPFINLLTYKTEPVSQFIVPST